MPHATNINRMTTPTPALPLAKSSAHAKQVETASDTTKLTEFFKFYHEQVRNLDPKADKISDFCFGNPQQIASSELVNIFQKALIPKNSKYYAYRTSVDGPRDLLAKSAAKRYAFEELDPEDVFFTSGNFAGIAITLKLFVESDDNVVYMEPGWFLYRSMILAARGIPKPITMSLHNSDDDDSADMRAFLDAIDANTKIVILNQPHNPSGKVYSRAWLKQFSEKLLDISRTRGYPVYLLADEAYSDFVFDGAKHETIAAIYPYTILAYTYNKLTLAPSQRVGYLILSPLMPGRQELRNTILPLQVTLGWCLPNAAMMESVPELEIMRDTFDATVISRRRDRMCDILEKIGYKLLVKPKGSFYMLLKSPIKDDMKFCRILAKRKVFVLPGNVFNAPGCFRICLTATDEMIELSADEFREGFEEAVQGGV